MSKHQEAALNGRGDVRAARIFRWGRRPQLKHGTKGDWLLLGAIMILGAGFRVPSLLNDGLWRDQANVWVQVSAPTFGEFMHRVIGTEWHPPLYFVFMYLWTKVAGMSELAFEAPSFIFSILTIPFVYRLGRTVGSTSTGLLASAMFAVAPLAISYSTEYLYPLTSLLYTILVWLYLKVRDDLTRSGAIALAAVSGLVVFTHYTGLLLVLILVVVTVVSRRIARRAAVALALGFGMLSFGFWLPIFLAQAKIGVPYASETTVLAKAAFLVEVLLKCIPAQSAILQGIVLAALVSGVLVVAQAGRIRSTASTLMCIFLIALFVITAKNLLAVRYVYGLYGVLCVFLAWVILELERHLASQDGVQWRRWGLPVATLFAVVIVIGDFVYSIENSEAPKSGIRSLVQKEGLERRTLYVIAPDYLASTFAYYSRDKRVTYRGFARHDDPKFFRLAGYAAVWRDPEDVIQAERAIAVAACRFTYINVIVDNGAIDAGKVPYGKVWTLLQRLRGEYRLVKQESYAGRLETVSSYRFAVSRSEGSSVQRARDISGKGPRSDQTCPRRS